MGAELLDRSWWERVIVNWNARPTRVLLKGLGRVVFVVVGAPDMRIAVEWDASGEASVVSGERESVAEFSATPPDWNAFVDGEFTAAMGVLQRRIHFRGAVLRIMPRLAGFDELARVARETVL